MFPKTVSLFILALLLLPSCMEGTDDNRVLVGADRTEAYLPLIGDRTCGIVANHTSLVNGVHLVDTLLALDINLARIFSPEHGFRGKADAGEHIDSGTDSKTGLPLVSLYGERRKPLVSDMEGLDIIIFDIQDVGARFYTYISTLQYVMERAAECGVKVIVFDRPNPNASYIDGPVLDPAYRSFVGMQAVPVVYGMTVGEYAMMINSEGWLADGLNCDLEVIKCFNYTHNTEYILPVAPSPNLPNQNSVYLYPSLCFFEGTIFSCGRGTDYPFQVFGHPAYHLQDFSFRPVPGEGAAHPKLEGQLCYGKDLRMAAETGIVPDDSINLEWLLSAYKGFPDKEIFFNSYFNTIAGTDILKQQIIDGLSPDEIRASWQEDLDKFKAIREKYLLYQ